MTIIPTARADRHPGLTIPRDATGGPKEAAVAGWRGDGRGEAESATGAAADARRQVRMVDTTQGLRIDLVDDSDFSMFPLGTTMLTAGAPTCSMRWARCWRPKAANWWSAATPMPAPSARASRSTTGPCPPAAPRRPARNCMRHGLPEGRFRRIEGVADREPLMRTIRLTRGTGGFRSC